MSKKIKELFIQALMDIDAECYIDAITVFQGIVEEDPSSTLADDAIFNMGICYIKTGQFGKAHETFLKILSDYPDTRIDQVPHQREYGRTAAKALLALVDLALAENKRMQAVGYAEQLKGYTDSYIMASNSGVKTTYFELAEELLSHE